VDATEASARRRREAANAAAAEGAAAAIKAATAVETTTAKATAMAAASTAAMATATEGHRTGRHRRCKGYRHRACDQLFPHRNSPSICLIAK
jgi:hypothetical protein